MSGNARWIYGACVSGGLVFTAIALHLWGAAEIRATPVEVVFLTGAAAVWLVLATKLFSWFGLSLRDDAVERKNASVLIALCGAVVGAVLLYIGGSVGEGPSYLENVFSGGIAAIAFFALWLVLELIGKVSFSIAEDRDVASGLRFSAFSVAIGLVLGRAVAGDWHSESATIHDFVHDGWPAALICALAGTIEILVRPNRLHPFRAWKTFGLIPALCYIALSAMWLWHVGAWEGMPR